MKKIKKMMLLTLLMVVSFFCLNYNLKAETTTKTVDGDGRTIIWHTKTVSTSDSKYDNITWGIVKVTQEVIKITLK